MGYLTREQILGAQDRKVIELDVPEWGGTIRLRSMSGLAAEEYIKAVQDAKTDFEPLLLLISSSVIGDDNELMFPAPEDVKGLASKNLSALKHVSEACMEVNGFNQEEVAEALKETASE